MRKAYKFRLYPTKYQVQQLETMLETHRRLWNKFLGMRTMAWKSNRVSMSYHDQSSFFKEERKTNHWAAEINYSSAQATMKRLDKAFIRFFKRVQEHKPCGGKKSKNKFGYPKFKKFGKMKSILFPKHGDGIRFLPEKGRVRVQNVGVIKVKNHQEVKGEIKTLSLKTEAGKWFLVLSCELPDPSPETIAEAKSKPAVGIDLGLEAFATLSNGERIENPRFQKKALKKLRRENRAFSRKKKGGKGSRKQAKRLGRVHWKIGNQRRDFNHKEAGKIADRFGLIAAEDLRIKNMLKNRRLARSISDAGWGLFLEALANKAFAAGSRFVLVDPRNTSQECSRCGRIVPKELSERMHVCPFCGLVLHRDVNAARVVLKRALARSEPQGGVDESVQLEAPCHDAACHAAPSGPLGSPRL